MTEMAGIPQFMTQDCSGIGISSTSGYVSLRDTLKEQLGKQKRKRKTQHDKSMEQIGTLINGVQSIVNNQKAEHEKYADTHMEEMYKKNLRDAENDLLNFQKREEALDDLIDEKEHKGTCSTSHLDKLKNRLSQLEKVVKEKEEAVQTCKRDLAKWRKGQAKKKRKNKNKDKGELVAEIITPPPTHPRRSVLATSTSVTNDSTSNDTNNEHTHQTSIANANTSPGENVMQEGRRLLQLSDSEDESDTFSY